MSTDADTVEQGVIMPAAEGWFLDVQGDVWKMTAEGELVYRDIVYSEKYAAQFAPFTALVPASVLDDCIAALEGVRTMLSEILEG